MKKVRSLIISGKIYTADDVLPEGFSSDKASINKFIEKKNKAEKETKKEPAKPKAGTGAQAK